MLIPSSGSWLTRGYPANSGREVRTHPGQDTIPSQCVLTHTHTHTQLYWDNLDNPKDMHAVNLTCISLGHGRKLEYTEKTRIDMGRMCKLHTVAAAWYQTLFSYQCYNEMKLFVDLQ